MLGRMIRNMARALRGGVRPGVRDSHAADPAPSANAALDGQYALLATTLDNLDQGIVMYDPELRVIAWNRAWARLRGFDDAFLETRPDIAQIMRTLGNAGYFADSGMDVESRVAYWTGVMATASRPFLAEQPLADGRVLEVWTNPLPDVGYVATVTDVTERRRLERMQSEQKEIIEATLENVDQAIVMFDRDRRVAAWNRRYAQMFGLDPDFLDEHPTLADVVRRQAEAGEWDEPAGGIEAKVRYWTEKTVTDIAASSTTRVERARPDGTVIEARTNRLTDGGFVTAFADLTRQRRFEAAIRAAKEAAENANQAKSVFLATMSHEIRTPMNGVIGMLELLSRSRLDSDQREMIGTVRESATALLRIIDDILDLSKIEAGRMTIEAVATPLAGTVEGVAETLAPAARAKDLDLVVLLDPNLPSAVLGDPTRLRQILFNLAGNAVKFTQRGRVVLAAGLDGAADGRVIVRFRVQDTGIGIPEDRLAGVFEPFVQAEGSTTRRFGGTGLGLSIARHLVELMGGEIGVDSVPGRGSTFWFTVPFQAVPGAAGASKPPDVAAQGLRVLIAAGEGDERQNLAQRLKAAGVDAVAVGAAGDGRGPFDVALIAEGAETPDSRARATVTVCRVPAEPGGAPSVVRPIRRQALLNAIAAAAGRAPAVVEEAPAPVAARPPDVEEARRLGRLILIVDDHPINRTVLRRQLEELGHAVEVAEDGRRALALWRESRHAVVLTDCQMPEMDGYDLAMAIRGSEVVEARRTAIVGVSASVLASDVERSLMSGMDEFVTKPVSLERLAEVLARALPDAAATAAARPEPEPEKTAILDLALLGRIGRDNPGLLRDLLAEFVAVGRETIAEIERAADAGAAGEAGRLAHRLVGASATAGAFELAAAVRRIEAAGDSGDMAGVRRHLTEMAAAFRRVESEIQAL